MRYLDHIIYRNFWSSVTFVLLKLENLETHDSSLFNVN